MDSEFAFINAEDQKAYLRLKGGIRRSIVEVPATVADAPRTGSPQAEALELVANVTDQLSKHFERFSGKQSTGLERNWFGCHCIEVKPDDGQSWSAEAVNLALKEKFSRFNHWLLTSARNTDSPSAIADFLGLGTFLRLAGKHKLGSIWLTGRSWLTWGVVGLGLVMAVGAAMIEFLTKTSPPIKPYYLVAVAALLGLGVKYLAPFLVIRTLPDKLKNLNDTLDKVLNKSEEETALSPEGLPPNYQKFIESLAMRLAFHKFPRYVIVDGYGNQDPTTKRVIRRYFEQYAADATGGEFWVVFDGRGEKFSTLVRNRHRLYGFKNSKLFRQTFIRDDEKRSLVEQLKLSPRALGFRAIKLVCKEEETTRGTERAKRLLDNYRSGRGKPGEPGPMEFLYLLSLTAAHPTNFTFGFDSMKSKMSKKGLMRSYVLSEVLQGTKLVKSEFEDYLDGIEREFQTIVEITTAGTSKSLHVNLETALAFEANAASWSLPPRDLGHLYWSLYWLDDKGGSTIEAIWTEKLSRHLIRAKIEERLKDANSRTIIGETLFNGALNTATACLKSGVFEYVPKLLQKAFELIDGRDLANNQIRRERIIKKSWEAYSLLGEDQILEVLFDLYEISGRQTQAGEASIDGLSRLFFQSIPLERDRRIAIGADFFDWIGWSSAALESITQYAHARSAWLAFSLSPFSGSLNGTELRQAVIESDKLIDELTRKALERVKDASEQYLRITDILTVSLAIWCNALRLRPTSQEISRTDPSAGLDVLLDLATTAVLRAVDIRKSSNVDSKNEQGVDFLSSGLAKELYSVSLGAVILACHYFPDELSEKHIKHINDIVEYSEDLMDVRLEAVNTRDDLSSESLIRSVDQMLTFCEILWDSFGYGRLRDFMNIRRIHFNTTTLAIRDRKKIADEVIRESIDAARTETNFTGLIANLVTADCLRQVGNFEAHYLRKAGSIALSAGFDPQLRHELSLTVIKEIHHLSYDLSDYLRDLLADDGPNGSFFLRFLKQLDPEEINTWLLAIHNVSNQVKQPDLKATLKKTMQAFVASIRHPKVQQTVDHLLRYYDLIERLGQNEPLNSAEVMEAWREQRDSPVYPAVLNVLLDKDTSNQSLIEESISVFNNRNYLDAYNFALLLALQLVVIANTEKLEGMDVSGPLSYLREGIERWKQENSIDLNLYIYGVLIRVDDDAYKTHHMRMLDEWTHNKIVNEHLELLTTLVGQGQYFLIFSDYYRTMSHWGLRTETGKTEAEVAAPVDPATKIAQWLQAGAEPPTPLVGNNVSLDFIQIGSYLFAEPFIQNRELDEARVKFNQATAEIMPRFLNIIIALPLLTPSIKNLLQAYYERFLRPVVG